ncbi:MAG: N-acetylmuramic acid 6-phosphate etherase [Bacillus sp. (in: firmicutes)]
MIEHLSTEKRNGQTMELDAKSTIEILQIMNQEDQAVPLAVEREIKNVDTAVKYAVESLRAGGRLIYTGAGTSGRLGVLDAVECPPTFGIEPGKVIGLIAGGKEALFQAVEGAEDSEYLGEKELKGIALTSKDTVIGIAASGRTPYVIGALRFAKQTGAKTVSIACNEGAIISGFSDVAIELNTGAEILTGSTRLKAGTAQKMVLNMISTAAMIGMGKVYKNLMVDVQPTNEKLMERSIRIIMEAAEVDRSTAETHYKKANRDVKAAIVMILTDCTLEEANKKLRDAKGFIRKTI